MFTSTNHLDKDPKNPCSDGKRGWMYDEILWRDIEFVEVGSRGVPGSGPGFFFINKKIDAYNTLITRKAWGKSKQK